MFDAKLHADVLRRSHARGSGIFPAFLDIVVGIRIISSVSDQSVGIGTLIHNTLILNFELVRSQTILAYSLEAGAPIVGSIRSRGQTELNRGFPRPDRTNWGAPKTESGTIDFGLSERNATVWSFHKMGAFFLKKNVSLGGEEDRKSWSHSKGITPSLRDHSWDVYETGARARHGSPSRAEG